MMEKKVSSASSILWIYGLLSGVIAVLFFLLNYHLLGVAGKLVYLSLLSMIVLMFFGAKSIRTESFGGFLSYGESLKYTFWIGFIGAVISLIFTYFYTTIINPDYTNELLLASRMEIAKAAPQMSEKDIDKALSFASRFTSPKMTLVFGLLSSAFFSFLFALIVSIFVKRNKPLEEF